MQKKPCVNCARFFSKPVHESQKNWDERRKFCSLKCRFAHQKGKPLSDTTRKRMAIARTGERNKLWKGNNVGYHALHAWVKRQLGTPKVCSECHKTFENPRHIHWANKSGLYKRDTADWVRLCAWCHNEMDGTFFKTGVPNTSRKKILAN
jgi:hypothetical protein